MSRQSAAPCPAAIGTSRTADKLERARAFGLDDAILTGENAEFASILKSKNGAEVKVELGDYLPNLPQHTGHEATVEGRLIRYGDKYEFIGKSVDFRKP